MIKPPTSTKILKVFILVIATIWFVFGSIVVLDIHPAIPDHPLIKVGMFIMAFVIAGIFFSLWYFIAKRNRIAFLLTTGLLIMTSLFSIFDDFGLADLVFLSINLFSLALLIKDRDWYLQPNSINKVDLPW